MSVQRNDWSLQRKGVIDQDRHKERIKDAIKKNLGSIVSNESIILSNGRRTVKVPMRALDEYKFRFDYRKRKHVGQGDGNTKVGDVVGRENQQGQGPGQAGDSPGQDYYEAEVDIDEIAALIFEDLQLPFLEEKSKQAVQSKTTKFTEIRRTGVLSNLDKRRTILENIRRQARDKGHAKLGPIKKEDLRFKTWEEEIKYESNAVVIAMMDVSGCFTAGHLIEMADGSYKDISEIKVGDRVACLDLQTYQKTCSTVSSIFTKRTKQTFVIESEDAVLRPTPEHVLFVYDERSNQIIEKKARDLEAGDKLIFVNSWDKSDQRRGRPACLPRPRHQAPGEVPGQTRRSAPTLTYDHQVIDAFNRKPHYAYHRPDLHALSAAQLRTIAADQKATADDLRAIEEALDSQLLVSKIKTIRLQDAPVDVYDFEVADHHNYIVDGILSHNSMGEFKKYIARSFFFWMVRFLRTKYDNVKIVFISHHTEAKEVSEEQFFTQGESGGTVVSSAYRLALEIIADRYPARDWNVYPFHFSDGDNYYSDNEDAVKLADKMIEICNLFGYGEIGEEGMATYRRSSGALLSIFNDRLQNKERFIGVRIDDKEDVYPALKEFFGKRGIEA